jgi:tetratricopeptide (TPR) repeat protein
MRPPSACGEQFETVGNGEHEREISRHEQGAKGGRGNSRCPKLWVIPPERMKADAAVIRKPEAELISPLNRLVSSGLLFRQGAPPQAIYLFKHALIQEAAYGMLLREPRRGLHARIAETLERGFPDLAENQPEVLARHCTEAGLIDKAAGLWGKAGHRSLARSALVEATEQLARALAQIATLPTTPALRREQIKLQIGLTNALMHTKGYAASETRVSLDQSRALIERAEAVGEPPEDPLLLFSVLYGFWVANLVAFNGVAVRELAAQFLALAERQGATFPLLLGHRIMGYSLMMLATRATGATFLAPTYLNSLATAYAELGQFSDAWRCVDEAMSIIDTTKGTLSEAEANRVAGEIALKSAQPDAAKAEAYFERALVVARQQQAKSFELRASMSLARLWRSQGKVSEVRELLAPVYGWFTEGFETRDLMEAKMLLEELVS